MREKEADYWNTKSKELTIHPPSADDDDIDQDGQGSKKPSNKQKKEEYMTRLTSEFAQDARMTELWPCTYNKTHTYMS